MANLRLTLLLNWPHLVGDLLLLVFAAWLVASPRRRSRAAIWLAAALSGKVLSSVAFLFVVSSGLNISRDLLMGMVVVGYGPVGLLFASVVVDRPPGASR